jgi:HEAT repeat protein
MLREGTEEKSAQKRADAIMALGSIGLRPEVVRRVELGLTDSEPLVRQAAAATLGEMKWRGAIPKLKAALADKSGAVRFAAAQALWDLDDHSGRDVLGAVLAGEGGGGAGDALKSEIGGAKKTLSDPRKLGMLGVEQGAGALLGPYALGFTVAQAIAKDRSAPERALCAYLLGADRDPQSIQKLEKALQDKNWLVRAAAARALGGSGQKSLLPKLQPLLSDKRTAVRYMAAASVIRLSDAPAM